MTNKAFIRIGQTARLAVPLVLACVFAWSLLCMFGRAIPAYAVNSTYYVEKLTGQDVPTCGSATAPCRTIGYALTKAHDDDVINVAQGLYSENLAIPTRITLNGGFSGKPDWIRNVVLYPTTISSNSVGQAVVALEHGSSGTLLDGLTVTGGDSFRGGGLYIDSDVDLAVRNCIITGNAAEDDGGGIVAASNSSLLLESSVVSGNTSRTAGGGGIIVDDRATLTITGTLISDNTAYEEGGGIKLHRHGNFTYITNSMISGNHVPNGNGGGIALVNHSTAYFTNTHIIQNEASARGGGIEIEGDSMVHLSKANILNNTALTGGGLHAANRSAIVVADSIISDNSATDSGAGVRIESSTQFTATNVLVVRNQVLDNQGTGGIEFACCQARGTLMNVTVAENSVASGTGGIDLGDSNSLTAVNSIIAFNSQDDLSCGNSTCAVSYSNVEGGWAGTGNISDAPLFVGSGDYHLQRRSPCINAGTATGAPSADIEGTLRDARPDMGAYEWQARVYLPVVRK